MKRRLIQSSGRNIKQDEQEDRVAAGNEKNSEANDSAATEIKREGNKNTEPVVQRR